MTGPRPRRPADFLAVAAQQATLRPVALPEGAPELERHEPQAVYDANNYGDMVVKPFTFAAAGSVLALERPKHVRIFLLIQNRLGANPIEVAWDTPGQVGNGITLPAGGNVLFDSRVPQNDLFIFSPVAGFAATVAFINVNLRRARAG